MTMAATAVDCGDVFCCAGVNCRADVACCAGVGCFQALRTARYAFFFTGKGASA